MDGFVFVSIKFFGYLKFVVEIKMDELLLFF